MQLLSSYSLNPFLLLRTGSLTHDSRDMRRVYSLLYSCIMLYERLLDGRYIHASTVIAGIAFYRGGPCCHVGLQHYGEELLLI